MSIGSMNIISSRHSTLVVLDLHVLFTFFFIFSMFPLTAGLPLSPFNYNYDRTFIPDYHHNKHKSYSLLLYSRWTQSIQFQIITQTQKNHIPTKLCLQIQASSTQPPHVTKLPISIYLPIYLSNLPPKPPIIETHTPPKQPSPKRTKPNPTTTSHIYYKIP